MIINELHMYVHICRKWAWAMACVCRAEDSLQELPCTIWELNSEFLSTILYHVLSYSFFLFVWVISLFLWAFFLSLFLFGLGGISVCFRRSVLLVIISMVESLGY